MKLRDLLEALGAWEKDNPVVGITGRADPEAHVPAITCRSRDVVPGGLFVAVSGTRADGADYIEDAVSRGAAVIVTEKPDRVPSAVVGIGVTHARHALANLAATFYGHPSRDLSVVAVTGTNGKTTATWLLEGILTAAGARVGVIGTISTRYLGHQTDSLVTTPESLDLQKTLRDMVDAGVTHVVLEASSHALDQGRIRFCNVDVGVFTNLSRDHLDYHEDMEAYFRAKKSLFADYMDQPGAWPRAKAVICTDDPFGLRLANEITVPHYSTGLGAHAAITVDDARFSPVGIVATVVTPKERFTVNSSLVGPHNLLNILSAVGAARALGCDTKAIRQGIADTRCVPGRLEPVANTGGRYVFVDFAHTPQALEKVLAALAEVSAARIITVFGAGGDRDRGKRPKMAESAAEASDVVIITSDNPRTEDPLAIIADIEKGLAPGPLPRAATEDLVTGLVTRGYTVEPDRTRAIETAVAISRPQDVVLIAGKGHEPYQIVGHKRLAFDDRQKAAAACASLDMGGCANGHCCQTPVWQTA